MSKKIDSDLEKNIETLDTKFNSEDTFDFSIRRFRLGGQQACLAFLESLSDDLILNRILDYLLRIDRGDLGINKLKDILNRKLPYQEIDVVEDFDKAIEEMLAGPQVIFVDGLEKAIVVDARTWQSRSPEEPELEKATRGPEDGFVETMIFNLQMIRRRIRDTNLRAKAMRVGERSQNDLALVYMGDIADPDLVKEIEEKIEEIGTDGLPLADRTVEDFLVGETLNPLPKVRYTNRPDNVAAHILEGRICILIDNSPTALILPSNFFDHIQSLEDFRQPVIPGTYLNLMRFASIFLSIALPAIWLVIAYNPDWLPEFLEIIGTEEEATVPIGLQFVLANFGIDLIRIASIQIPNALATSLGLIGALMLGEFSVEVGLFNVETILYMAIAAIANFTVPGFELAMTIEMFRLLLIIAVIYFRIWGLAVGLALIALLLVTTKSFGVPYLWPLIPFEWSALKSYLFRQSILQLDKRRPNMYNPQNKTRKKDQGGKEE